MQVDVIVMAEKTIQSIMDWQLRPDGKGALRAVYVDGSDQSPEKAWQDLALIIHSRALEGQRTRVDIFLYLRDGLHNSIQDYGNLEDTVIHAQHYVAGGKVYVVWDRLTENAFAVNFSEYLNRIQMANQILLAQCFCALLRRGVTDVIEIAPGAWAQGEGSFDENKILLRRHAVTSERRQQELTAVITGDGWGYVLRNEAWLLEVLLKELIRESGRPSSCSNHVVVFDAIPSPISGGSEGLLDKFKRINPAHKGIVATTPEGYSMELRRHCDKATPPLRLVIFNGVFEIMYALLQLNK